MRIWLISLIIGFSILALVLLALVIAGTVFTFYNTFNPRADRYQLHQLLHDEFNVLSEEKETELQKTKEDFLSENKATIVEIINEDFLKLHGKVYLNDKNPTNKWLIGFHAFEANGNWMLNWVIPFHKMGYNLLLVDQQAHGKSEGKYFTMGYNDRRDVLRWISYILKQDRNAEIVLYGVSMGAFTVLMASGEILERNVKAVIADSSFVDLKTLMKRNLKNFNHIPAFPFISLASLFTKHRLGFSIRQADARKAVGWASVPILIIHGTADKVIPFKEAEEIFQAIKSPAEILLIENGHHIYGAFEDPDLYYQTIENFIQKY